MVNQTELLEEVPDTLSLSDTLRLLVEELHGCAATLRETHELIAPQLDELERRYPNAAQARAPRDGQRSLGSAQGRDPA
jgi:hypothetical protein